MASCCLSFRTDTDDPHHACMHVIKQVAVEGPVADGVCSGPRDLPAGLHNHGMLARRDRRGRSPAQRRP
jgi:hypothetical protein